MDGEPLTTQSDLTTQVEQVLHITKVIPLHTHNGTDTLQIPQTNILNGTTLAVSGGTALTGNVVLGAGTNVTLTESGQTITINSTASFNDFGDGSDGTGSADGSTSIAGIAPVGNVYTLTRDVYFTSLTISTGVTITPAGYQIFVQGTTTINGTGKVARNGNAGAIGSVGGAGGAGGAALLAGTLPGGLAGIAGGGGGNGGGGGGANGAAGAAGAAGTNANPSIGSSGQVGTNNTTGQGGNSAVGSGAGGGGGGSAGTATLALNNPHT